VELGASPAADARLRELPVVAESSKTP